jgi:activator of HSP90 ATPase
METKTGTIRQKVKIGAIPEEVYSAYLDSRAHSKFTGSRASISPKVGGKMSAWDGYIIGRNLELVKGKKIVQEWRTTDWPAGYPPSILTITLRKAGRGTELTMVHSKVPKSQMKDYAEGWKEWYWGPLKEYFEKG